MVPPLASSTTPKSGGSWPRAGCRPLMKCVRILDSGFLWGSTPNPLHQLPPMQVRQPQRPAGRQPGAFSFIIKAAATVLSISRSLKPWSGLVCSMPPRWSSPRMARPPLRRSAPWSRCPCLRPSRRGRPSNLLLGAGRQPRLYPVPMTRTRPVIPRRRKEINPSWSFGLFALSGFTLAWPCWAI